MRLRGFGASAADVAAEAESTPGDIPDPTEFEAKPQADVDG